VGYQLLLNTARVMN